MWLVDEFQDLALTPRVPGPDEYGLRRGPEKEKHEVFASEADAQAVFSKFAMMFERVRGRWRDLGRWQPHPSPAQ